MVVLSQPGGYDAWDPLLQRFVASVCSKPVPAPRPLPIARAAQPPETPSKASPWLQTPGRAASAHGSTQPPPTPAELEAQSLALAWRLQQEEQSAFIHAVSASASSPRARQTPGGPALEEMETDDDSLQLAIRLQQEELRWQQLQSRQSIEDAMGGDAQQLLGDGLDDEDEVSMMLQAAHHERPQDPSWGGGGR